MKQFQSGFTLIELMVVITVLGILSALALAAYQDYLARTQLAEAMGLVSSGKNAIAEYYTNAGEYPTSNNAAGLAEAGSITGKYVSHVSVAAANGVLIARMRSSGVSEAVQGAALTLSPITHAGSVEWVCSGVTRFGAFDPLPNKYLPTVCRR